jgi:hypothetical protein
MNPDGGAVPQTFETASPDGKNRPRWQLPEKLAAVAPPKMGEKTHSAQSGCIFQNFIADLGDFPTSAMKKSSTRLRLMF